MGYDARAAIPALKAVISDKRSYAVRRAAEDALNKITAAKPSGVRKIEKK